MNDEAKRIPHRTGFNEPGDSIPRIAKPQVSA